ncbi:MAG: FAD-binding and (Fe-S)-binding domain-containing protein [Anaerolineales bacterium]
MDSELLTQFTNFLRRETAGDVRFDAVTRKLYSTDASIYQIEPLGVVFPSHQDDLDAILSLSSRYGIPILPRGSGTSLAGQTIGPAVIIDFSRNINKILEVNPEERWAWVQPGLVLNTFNAAVGPSGLMYGPDPASADRATFGGMLGNNSTGAHSISYGMTSDNVIAVDALLSDGSPARFESVKMQEAISRAESETIEGSLYRRAIEVRERKRDLIMQSWPRTWRKASGYSMNYVLPWSASRPPMWGRAMAGNDYPPVENDSLNLAPLLVGSEGTLAVFKRIKIRLVPRPLLTVLGVLSYPSIAEACDATPGLLEAAPSAIELIPQAMIRLARSVPAYARKLGFVRGDPEAILIVEFAGDDANELESRLESLGPQVVKAMTKAEQDEVWSVRKVGLGLLMSRAGDTKPLPFIEDVAVPVERLGEFVRGFEKILTGHDTNGDFYAHASAGCLHVRPLINLKTARGVEQMRGITQSVMAMAKRLGGAMSGEHGDGLSHGEWLEETFGPAIIEIFSEVKKTADPRGLLNPGKVLNPQRMDQNLRYGPDYRDNPWIPVMNFDKQGGLAGAIEMCNGAGVCRKDGGVMCPSFQATRDEMHSTRGRANLLRAMISTGLPSDKKAESAVHAALDLCLECKGCKAECPSGVDMAKLKYEFLFQYYQKQRRPIRDYLFGNLFVLGRFSQILAPIANTVLQSAPGKAVGEALFGLSAKRGLPALKRTRRWKSHSANSATVLFLRDPFTELFYPEITASALKVLEVAGHRPAILPVAGAGRTLISKGFLPEAQNHAQRVLRAVQQADPLERLPLVGVEPSDIYTVTDEYLDLLPDEPSVSALAKRTYMLDEFLLRPVDFGPKPLNLLKSEMKTDPAPLSVLLHGHCYQKARPPADDGYPSGVNATVAFLDALGHQVELVNSGCCGMAGSFGYEAEHYDLSMQIGEMSLFPAVRKSKPDQAIVAAGVSCRAQIQTGTGREALHPISLVASQLAF